MTRHRERVPAAFSNSITLEEHRKGADYAQANSLLALVDTAVDLSLTLAWTLGGGLQGLDSLLLPWFGERGIAWGLALFACFAVISATLHLPLALYRQFVVEARFGFNHMTWRLFLADMIKQALLTVVIGGPALAVALWLMGAMGENWWLWAWLAWMGFNLILLLIYPFFIAPLFNTFTPLAEGALKTRIEALLKRCDFAAKGLFVMDGSKRTAHGNAYFTGFGRARRIVFFDTLLEKLTPEEAEAVLAHELGHFKRRHIVKSLALLSGFSLALLWLLGSLMQAPAFYSALGVVTPSTTMALILFSLALPPFLLPLAPLSSWLSRRHEFEADAYAAAQTRASDLITALTKLYRDNAATLTPDPLHSLFFDSHPPATLRVARLAKA